MPEITRAGVDLAKPDSGSIHVHHWIAPASCGRTDQPAGRTTARARLGRTSAGVAWGCCAAK